MCQNNASARIFLPTCCLAHAAQRLVSTTASKPSFPASSAAPRQAPRTRCLYYLTDQASEAPLRRRVIHRARCPRTRPAAGPAQRHHPNFKRRHDHRAVPPEYARCGGFNNQRRNLFHGLLMAHALESSFVTTTGPLAPRGAALRPVPRPHVARLQLFWSASRRPLSMRRRPRPSKSRRTCRPHHYGRLLNFTQVKT